MSTSSTRVRDDPPTLVCRRTDEVSGDEASDEEASGEGASDDGEVTFYEPDRDPDERTTRWITVTESDCVPQDAWR
ncbi:hypothetical protein GJ633_16155 [Halorubrum sp. CBA1125]|uniref:DUF7511 domain-containing protein n=1 Tax=Halorubrum sp. CBA1125 TaxID=2668072 RepID=UPI0012E77B60|nr:hypothetical protein [Halorubrum sp. CBA1125]MUW15955.1 hypothetical protein [Halorubrum sp. CBA1125]